MSLNDIGRQAAEATASGSSGGGDAVDPDDYERIDVSDMGFVKVHPGTTAIGGTAVALRYFPPYNEGEYDDNDRGYAGLVLEDPYIPESADDGVTIFESTKDKGDDYKVVNSNDESVDTYEAGVSVGQMFEADKVDEFSHDTIIVKLDTSAGRSVARSLDVCGLPNADLLRTQDGAPEIQDHGWPEFNDGLIEKCPDNDDEHYEPPQYIRDPQLRPDAEGQDVIVVMDYTADVIDDYDGNSHWATVLVDVEDERAEELASQYAESEYYGPDEVEDFIDEVDGTDFLRMAPTDEFEPDELLVRATHYSEWRWLQEDEVETLREEQGIEA